MKLKKLPKGLTKGEAAKLLYPGLVVDWALPQYWVDKHAPVFDVRPHFVWGYPDDSLFGKPYPVTQEGQTWLEAEA